ncbi:hypothetical protein [Sphingomonas radiodurans]|nr:hypothetical protein [Sphingomonas radiodurans]WBH17984.1 hypothetical protein LLW23_07805 [Sphingomonas radiodurans]
MVACLRLTLVRASCWAGDRSRSLGLAALLYLVLKKRLRALRKRD